MESFGRAVTATEGALGFDCDVPLTPPDVMQFAAAGFTWCARYLSRGEEAVQDLQALEVRALHMSGVCVVPVQHVARSGWYASTVLGHTLGTKARLNAGAIGCPAGVTLWLDLEGVTPRCRASDIVGFCNAWTAEVTAGGYGAGLYVGANCGLTSAQLYHLLSVRRYWRSLSRSSPDVDVRGFQLIQGFGATIAGVAFDRDIVAKDAFGDLPIWWAPT